MITQILLENDMKTVYKVTKSKTNYLYSIGGYTRINWIIAIELAILLSSCESLFIKVDPIEDI